MKLSKRSEIFNWGQIVHNWDIIVRIKYQHYIYAGGAVLGHHQYKSCDGGDDDGVNDEVILSVF